MVKINMIKPFVPNTPFLYPLKTSENRLVFRYFQRIEKGCIENKWIKIKANINTFQSNLSFLSPLKNSAFMMFQNHSSRDVLRKRCSEQDWKGVRNRRTPMLKCDFNKVALQLYWNCILVWVFSCKFTAYFQSTFL